MGAGLLSLGLLVAAIGWMMMFTFVGVDVSAYRSAEEVVNLHRLGITIGVIVTGFGIAALGGIAMIFERVAAGLPARPAGSFPPLDSEGARPKLGILFITKENGAVVNATRHGSPAQLSGLTAGDVIIAVNGVETAGLSEAEILSLLAADLPKVDLLVLRSRKELVVSIPRLIAQTAT
jgi:S1-C subfamily serine protease